MEIGPATGRLKTPTPVRGFAQGSGR
jgi:hypothetical protein